MTWGALPEAIRSRTKLVVPACEAKSYSGYPLLLEPESSTHNGQTRQFIFEQAKGNFFMLDDDITFAIRRTDNPTKFHNARAVDVLRLFEDMEDILRGYAHGGIAMREGANRNTDQRIYATRMARAIGYNLEKTRKAGLRFDRVPGMDDFDATLQLLKQGHTNVVINWMVQNQGGSQTLGGCSTWRTMETQSAAARKLAELHPGYVKVVQKHTKTSWQGQAREDVVVQWKRCLNDHT